MDADKFIHEAYSTMVERTIRRLWILCIIIFLAFVGTNAGWVLYESKYSNEQTTTIDATQDGGGYNFISGGELAYSAESKDYDN